jgi:serine/threonine protein phosphatase 1
MESGRKSPKGVGRTLVIGDIHGAYRALQQCLERSGFDYETDRLICLGDVCDGWPETMGCIEALLKVKNLVYILGNHDWWTLDWMTSGVKERIWFMQGGEATINSYAEGIPDTHIRFFSEAKPYYLEDDKHFVHAGFDPAQPLMQQGLDTFLWDRNLARIAFDFYVRNVDAKLTPYTEVYLGHTPIPYKHPVKACDVWLMDTGAGWSGVLSMMDIDTKEVFVSDEVPELYPGVVGRTRK